MVFRNLAALRRRLLARRDLLAPVEPMQLAGPVLIHSCDGYATNLSRAGFAAPNALLTEWNGAPPPHAAAPSRLVVPPIVGDAGSAAAITCAAIPGKKRARGIVHGAVRALGRMAVVRVRCSIRHDTMATASAPSDAMHPTRGSAANSSWNCRTLPPTSEPRAIPTL